MPDAVLNPFPITNPARIPAERYYDEAFFKAEKERLWPLTWQMACRLEESPTRGIIRSTKSSTARSCS